MAARLRMVLLWPKARRCLTAGCRLKLKLRCDARRSEQKTGAAGLLCSSSDSARSEPLLG